MAWSSVLGFLNEAPPAPLPPPPAVERYLFEAPMIGIGLLALVAVAVGVTLFQRGRARTGLGVGVGLLALCVGWSALARVVETDREAIVETSRSLIVSASAGDEPGVQRLLHPDATLAADGWMWARRDREGILTLLRRVPGGAMETAILEKQAVLDGPGVGRVQVRVRARAEGFLDIAWWRFDLRREPNGYWRVARIERLTRGLGGG